LGATAVVLAVMSGACASRGPFVRQDCVNPDSQLTAVLVPYEELRAKGCTADCDRLRMEIERLAVVCSGHTPTLMANAVIAYDANRPVTAQQLLDVILSQAGSHPEAAVLRARIALEEGNVPFATRLLEQHMTLAPDHAGLHETYGGALYLARRFEDSERELSSAAALGAPRWRIAYHLGLIREGQGRFTEAVKLYTEAVAGNPGWAPAEARLKALRATRPD
jgi:predicted Zn-dependent protease